MRRTMTSIIFSLVLVFLTNFLIEPTTCALPTYLQNRELDDITSLRHEFPSIIRKIKVIVNRLHCPKGWIHFGGSCYYLSNITSTPTQANHTCNLLHSNRSNLMQIRNTIELFYAVYILTKNKLSALMIDINPNLLKEKRIAEILMDDQGRWQYMKDKIRETRVLKEKFLGELNSADLRISKRSKKLKQKFIDSGTNYYKNQTKKNNIFSNYTTTVDQYEYDNLNFEDESDELFKQIEDLQGICDRIDWNVINNNSTIYMLTTSFISDKTICSFSNVESNLKYQHVCEYVLDFCFANIDCGKYGRCVNTLSGFKCSCSFLYDGLHCKKISKQGRQIIIGLILALVLYALSTKPTRWVLIFAVRGINNFCKVRRRIRKQKKQNNIEVDLQESVPIKKIDKNHDAQIQNITDQCRPTIAQKIMEFILPKNNDPIGNPNEHDLIRFIWVGGLSIVFLSLLFSITTIIQFTSFKYDITDDNIQLVAKCGSILNYRMENLIFSPIAIALILIFSWSIKRERRCLNLCDGRPGLIPPIEPFRTTNRFTTATVFGILVFEILKIFEEFLFSTDDLLNRGIFIELLERIVAVLLIGLRYYPVLVSLQLHNIAARFFVCLYILADITYTIIREGSCMAFFPSSRYYSVLDEAKLRMELGTWFTIYVLIKNTPHFVLLSYITAELCVRFAYDSIYVPCKKKRSIWSSPIVQPDESAFAKYYVTKLFRRTHPSTQIIYSTDVNIDELQDFEYEAELQRKANPSCFKKLLNSIYHWDDDFRFTTMATCTYTVAVIFLYYLACTLVFLYISRITDHISFLRYYIGTTFNIEFQELFPLRSIIIITTVITVMIYAYQLYAGIQNYKKHKLQLFKGIYEDIPSTVKFVPNTIALKSIRYFGFVVGYMACGFIVLFHFILLTLIAIRIISLQIPYIELVLAICVPVLVFYLLIMVSISSAGKFLFIQGMEGTLHLKSRKIYAIFVYFNFFIDCFLSFVSCTIRLIKATFLNMVFMARLDYSLHGRPLEKFDSGFTAYVSYLHIEVAHTNPIMLAFCYSLYDDIIQRRPKHCYDDECCIAPGELDDDEIVIEQKPKVTKNVSWKTSNRGVNESSARKTKVHEREAVSPIANEQNSIDTDDDDEGLSIEEPKSRNSLIISEKASQKSKPQMDNDIQDEEEEEEQPKDKSSAAKLKPISNVSTAFHTISHMFKPDVGRTFDEIIRQKRARFRWFLAYTILNNYQLFDLRKQVQNRLAQLRIERSNLNDEQQYVAATSVQQSIVQTDISESGESRQRNQKITTPTTDTSVSFGQRPTVTHGQLSIPRSDVDDYHQSPAERYIAIRSSMLYDVNTQQADTPPSPFVSQGSSTDGQQPRIPNFNTKSFRFPPSPSLVIQSLSASPSKSKAGNSPFQHPRQVKTINETTKKYHQKQTNSEPSSSDIEDNNQDK